MKLHYKTVFILFVSFAVLFSCNVVNDTSKSDSYDLPMIKKRGKLVAVTDYNSTSYFIYRGTPMGYQYDMLNLLAKHLDLDLEIVITNDLDDAFNRLNAYKCDIVAISLTVTNERKNILSFTEPIGQTRQVLVQKKPYNWEKMAWYNIEKQLLRNQLDLAGKSVHVMKSSAYVERLKNLAEEIGDTIHIVEVEHYEVEQLITLIDKGEIEYTVADEEVALLNQTYYPSIDVKTAISFSQNQAWAVNKNNKELLMEVNKWIEMISGTDLQAVIYNKYFKNKKASKRNTSPYISLKGGKISIYDKYIKKYSKLIDWDWRLLASLIFQESRFNSEINSWAGAFGLMQLMPLTAKRFGASKHSSPEKNIIAGVKFIRWLNTQLKDMVKDDEERKKFILASYNVGLGHVLDARRLAEANGKNPNIWTDNVDFFILNKSNPEYYNSELVKYGYCRGIETFNYVKEVVARYEMYKEVIR
ncbi:MAG: transporter substrate-binding domain-containing protein [Salinivirgaceae bacterium]|jgi:membrane-bound lytic murein transglycosylase F|nr:transporter substrate-binding domain-containing protein [Salinivirgaceae bacterium]